MAIQKQWQNSRGETVVLTTEGRLQVTAANGQPVSGAALNARRCDRAASPSMWRSIHNADANGVIELPFMAIKPYWMKDKT